MSSVNDMWAHPEGPPNQTQTGITNRRWCKCPSSVRQGDPVLLGRAANGHIPAVAAEDYDSDSGGAVFIIEGTFKLTVTSTSGIVVYPGSQVFAAGTQDTVTNIFLISRLGPEGTFTFGHLDPSYGKSVDANATDPNALVFLPARPI